MFRGFVCAGGMMLLGTLLLLLLGNQHGVRAGLTTGDVGPGTFGIEFAESTLSWIDAGVGGVEGHVAAYGDFDSDKYSDLFVVDEGRHVVTVHTWQHGEHRFVERQGARIVLPAETRIVNVVPTDFNRDGALDVLLELVSMTGEGEGEEERMTYGVHTAAVAVGTSLAVHFGNHSSFTNSLAWPSNTLDQVLVFDYDGDLWPDLLGTERADAGGGAGPTIVWRNRMSGGVEGGFERLAPAELQWGAGAARVYSYAAVS
eukprot:CAMPEP_0119137052 /NCGR_PEP_ID=MMETSP1310-20130426/22769_1 /TAXON_ID=464262 /ORGANISM="Genus nov. species nov., Strain RCC2339" /LENGTH=257 /DNA_ID=CAMNT_0007128103 /DNA_START=156 /DNA_END=926 /DNA_ORIENTATION=-